MPMRYPFTPSVEEEEKLTKKMETIYRYVISLLLKKVDNLEDISSDMTTAQKEDHMSWPIFMITL